MQQQQIMAPEPPGGVWEAIWPILQPALTPELVGGIVITLFATQAVKTVASLVIPKVTHSIERWRAFCTLASLITGTLVGVVVWTMSQVGWAVVPIIAIGSGPVWRLIQAFLPAKIASTFLTETDRHFRQEAEDEIS